MTWRHWVFCLFLVYFMVSMYGAGLQRGRHEVEVFNTEYIRLLEKHKYASRLVIDRLLIELDREPIFNTREYMQGEFKKAHEHELFNKENWLDG